MKETADYALELGGAQEYAKDVQNKIKKMGVRGFSPDKAKELGFFDRIAHLLALLTATHSAADRVYGEIDHMLTDYGVKRHEIKKNCTDFANSFDRFRSFWREGNYVLEDSWKDLNEDVEVLFHKLMHWARLPEGWNLGDAQRIDADVESVIRVDVGDRWLNMHRSIAEVTPVGEPQEEWCVTKYDMKTKKQVTVNTDVSKADAQMIAKRLSDNDPDNIYTASVLSSRVERVVEVIPMKAYKGNKVIGNVKKEFKKGTR